MDERNKFLKNTRILFVLKDGSPVKPIHFRYVLKKLIKACGLDESLHGTHSLRVGKASDLCKEDIRWNQLNKWADGSQIPSTNIFGKITLYNFHLRNIHCFSSR